MISDSLTVNYEEQNVSLNNIPFNGNYIFIKPIEVTDVEEAISSLQNFNSHDV